jgi:hypothetical protein
MKKVELGVNRFFHNFNRFGYKEVSQFRNATGMLIISTQNNYKQNKQKECKEQEKFDSGVILFGINKLGSTKGFISNCTRTSQLEEWKNRIRKKATQQRRRRESEKKVTENGFQHSEFIDA